MTDYTKEMLAITGDKRWLTRLIEALSKVEEMGTWGVSTQYLFWWYSPQDQQKLAERAKQYLTEHGYTVTIQKRYAKGVNTVFDITITKGQSNVENLS